MIEIFSLVKTEETHGELYCDCSVTSKQVESDDDASFALACCQTKSVKILLRALMESNTRALHFWYALIHTVARNTKIGSCILSEPGNLMLDKKSSWKSIPAVC